MLGTRVRVRFAAAAVVGAVAAMLLATCAPSDPAAGTPPAMPFDPANPNAAVRPMVPLPEAVVPPPVDLLDKRIADAIKQTQQRDLLVSHGFWTIFHAILGLGPEVTLVLDLGPDAGKRTRVNALDYVAGGGEMPGLRFLPDAHGLDVQMGPQFVGQGHQDQFISEMAQWGMPIDRPFLVDGQRYPFSEFVRKSQARARTSENQELSWAVMVIGHYHGLNAAWTNAFGEKLQLEDLVRYEVRAPMAELPPDKRPATGAPPVACGGTHRLFGLSWVYNVQQKEGGKDEGVWKDVADFTRDHVLLARKYQNPDGTFSTNFFRGRGDVPNLSLRINSTGHIFEWLALALTDDELKQEWVQNAANALTLLILQAGNQPVEGGSLYHATHGLIMYHARVYGPGKLGIRLPALPLPPGSRSVESKS